MSIVINPQTKVGALLDAYPGIDEVLIEWAPAFRKLKNPVLRRTVAKVATLEQAARVGGVSVRDLVLKLREATGAAGDADELEEEAVEEAGGEPAWLDRGRIRETIEADPMLERGVHPLGAVKQAVVRLEPGEIVALTSGFRPEPLIEAMRRSGLAVYCAEMEPGRHVSYFCRANDDAAVDGRVAGMSCGGCD